MAAVCCWAYSYIYIYSYIYNIASLAYTVWTLIFAVLNFRGFRGSTAIRESLVPRKLRSIRYSQTTSSPPF